MAARSTSQIFRDNEAAIEILKAIVDVVKNPSSLKEVAKEYVEANKISVEKIGVDAQAAAQSIAESQELLRKVDLEKDILQRKIDESQRKQAELDKAAQDVEVRTTDLQKQIDDFNAKLADLSNRELFLKSAQEALEAEKTELQQAKVHQDLREHNITEREEKLRNALM